LPLIVPDIVEQDRIIEVLRSVDTALALVKSETGILKALSLAVIENIC